MQRVGGISADLRPLWWSLAAFALVAAVGACGWIAWDAARGEPVPMTNIALPIALMLTAGAAGAAGLQARASAREQRLAEALHASRSRMQCIEDVLDVWEWRTDAASAVVAVRPPRGAEPGDWHRAAHTGSIWTLFRVADETALEARMRSGAPLDDIPVERVDGAARRGGILRGRPLHDVLGGFAGYVGVVREVPAEQPPAAAVGNAQAAPAGDGGGTEQESFSYTVSHDLRAPIRVVEGFTKIIKEDYGRLLDRVGNDHLDRVLGAAARMNNMIDALLALSRLASQPLARQPVNLSQLAGYVADDLRRQWPDRDVTLTIEPGLQLHGDPTLMRVVLENLLGNAWKYTAKSSPAEVGLERHPEAPDTFTVRDNGAGFDMRFADRLFGVFQRLHSANDFAGTGIGLASVRRIVRRHGGEIWGEGEVNRGARFHFSIPQTSIPQTSVPQTSISQTSTPQTSTPQTPVPTVAEASALPGRSQNGATPASSASSSRNA